MTISLVQKQKQEVGFSEEQNQLIKNYLCKGIDDNELKLFAAVCKKTGLDPFMKQIYAVKRITKDGPQMTIQTSIDGYRLIAERTGRYCPGKESTFTYKNDRVFSATSFVKKMTQDGTWHEIGVVAYYDEYCPPVTKSGYENPFWRDKPHIMLAKCAESLALRKAFPNELSGLYTEEEMQQASNTIKPIITQEQANQLQEFFDKCSSEFQEKMNEYLASKEINSLSLLPQECFKPIYDRLKIKSEEHQAELHKKAEGE